MGVTVVNEPEMRGVGGGNACMCVLCARIRGKRTRYSGIDTVRDGVSPGVVRVHRKNPSPGSSVRRVTLACLNV